MRNFSLFLVLSCFAIGIFLLFYNITAVETLAEKQEEVILNTPAIAQVNEIVDNEATDTLNFANIHHRLDQYFNLMHKEQQFNGLVLAAKNGKIMYKQTFGFADKSKNAVNNENTIFQLASVSKQFTAFAIVMLKEQGKLRYNDLVIKYLPKFPYPEITIRQLLTHRSGLFKYEYFVDNNWPRGKSITNKDLLEVIYEYKPENYHVPDKRYDYSNTGYAILASIVEEITGLDFPDFMQKSIFYPLGMHKTFISDRFSNTFPNDVAEGYNGRKKAASTFLDGIFGDKGVYSTAEDLLIWDKSLYNQTLVCNKTLDEAFEPGNPEMKRKNYGFGWRLCFQNECTRVIYHTGWWQGFKSAFIRVPDEKYTLIILSNKLNGQIKADECINLLFPEVNSDKLISKNIKS